MSDKKQVFLSLETAKKMWKEAKKTNIGDNSIQLFLLDNYSREELEAKELPKTFKDLKLLHGYFVDGASQIVLHTSNHSHLFHKNVFPTKELAEASLALSQLLQLRDVYNGNWKVDLNNRPNETRYIIRNITNEIEIGTVTGSLNYILSFQKESIRDKFVKNFEDLIIQALPIL